MDIDEHEHSSPPSDTPGSHGNKRPSARIARACAHCNKLKLRCDGVAPCSRCKDAGIAGECVFLPSMRGKTKRKKTQHQPSEAGSSNSINGSTSFTNPSTTRDQLLSTSEYRYHDPRQHSFDIPPTNLSSISPVPSTSTTSALPTVQTAFRIPTSRDRRRSPSTSGQDRTALTSLPLPGDAHNPLGVLAEASATLSGRSPDRRGGSKFEQRRLDPSDGKDFTDYYAASPSNQATRTLLAEAPHIMRIITPAEAESLFEVYWKSIHPHLPCLDKAHSQPIDVACRSNFLFNAICCISARSFNVALWEKLRSFAKAEMTRFPLDKNLDVVQGHLIYSEWNLIPARRFEQDMTWLRVGMAVRTAIDINLHRAALSDDARSKLPSWMWRSMVRTWLLAYIMDRTLSAQLGKPSSMRGESSVRRYLSLLPSPGEGMVVTGEAALEDVAVLCWTEWTQILARALDIFRSDGNHDNTGGNIGSQNCYPDLVVVFEKQFRQWLDSSLLRLEQCNAPDRKVKMIIGRINLYHYYSRLVIASFGLHRATDFNRLDLPAALARFQSCATHLIECFETDFDAPGFTRGCPDFVYTAFTYGVVSLLKSTQDRYSSCNSVPHTSIFNLCRSAANMLSRAATTTDHLPALQAGFLTRLLDIRTADSYAPGALVPQMVDFQAFADSIGSDPSRSHWPPSAVNSPNARKRALGGEDGEEFETGNDGGFPTSIPANGEDGVMGQNGSSAYLSDPPQFNGSFGGFNGSGGFVVPDVPTASFGLSVGSFLPDSSMYDMMFTNDTFWQSILQAPPQPGSMQTDQL